MSQDATVRVYVHRLRKKLDELYAGPGSWKRNACRSRGASTVS